MVSAYIREHELPYLVQAREQNDIKLTCLYLRDSTVTEETIDVELDSGHTVQVNLTQYQGLNRPEQPIAGLAAASDQHYTQAALDLKQILEPPPVVRPRRYQRYELTIQLQRQGRFLLRLYLHRYGRIYEHRDLWRQPLNPSGDDLFATLFGAGQTYEHVLRLLFQDDSPQPIRHAVRVRIHTGDPELAAWPWAQTVWNGYTLWEQGWTFELVGETTLSATPSYPDVTLHTPCPVLMITSPDAPSSDVHHRALEERLHRAWPVHHEPPFWARTWGELQSVWQRRRPGIVYYYGLADGDTHPQHETRRRRGRGGVSPGDGLGCTVGQPPAAGGVLQSGRATGGPRHRHGRPPGAAHHHSTPFAGG